MYAWRPSPRLQGRLHPRAVIPKVRQKIQLSQVAFQSKFQGRSQNDVLVVSAGLPSVSRRHRHSHSHSHSAYSHPHDRQPRHSLSRIGFTQHHLQSRGCEAKSFSTKSASHLGKTKDGKSNTKNYNHNKSATTRGKKTQQQTKNKRAETNIKKPGNSPLSSEPPVAIAKCFELNSTEARLFRSLRRHIQREKLDCTLRVCGGWVRDKLLGKESDDIGRCVYSSHGVASMFASWTG